jgi:hypothetical protein
MFLTTNTMTKGSLNRKVPPLKMKSAEQPPPAVLFKKQVRTPVLHLPEVFTVKVLVQSGKAPRPAWPISSGF